MHFTASQARENAENYLQNVEIANSFINAIIVPQIRLASQTANRTSLPVFSRYQMNYQDYSIDFAHYDPKQSFVNQGEQGSNFEISQLIFHELTKAGYKLTFDTTKAKLVPTGSDYINNFGTGDVTISWALDNPFITPL